MQAHYFSTQLKVKKAIYFLTALESLRKTFKGNLA